jgi:hypothetical protein
MKKIALLLALTVLSLFPKAQTMNEIHDRIALKNLVATFSILADQKEIGKQILLFTEDAVSETYVNGKIVST